MSWNLYEHRVHAKFKELYPDASIEYNARVRGSMSKRSRQLDSLITHSLNDVSYRIAIEAKYFDKKIGAKIVESFIGFLNDVGIEKGVLVTNEGFTKPALNRAENDPSDVELKILTMEELPDYIGFQSIVSLGPVEFYLESHPKWLIDGNDPTLDAIAKIHPKKYDWTKATAKNEYIYSTIFLHIDKDHKVLPDFDFQDMINSIRDEMFRKHQDLQMIEQDDFVLLDDEPTILLKGEMETISEYIAIASYDEYTVLFGLVTPNKLREDNLQVLGFFVEQLRPIFTTIPNMPNLSSLFRLK